MTTAAHEMGHGWRHIKGIDVESKEQLNIFIENDPLFNKISSSEETEERGASHIENIVRGELISNEVKGVGLRSTYSGLGLVKNLSLNSKIKYNIQPVTYKLLEGRFNISGYLNQKYSLNQITK